MSFAPSPTAPADLWAKLEALDLDAGATLSFSKRLARDNGWSVVFAQRVVLEYKKFVFLAATCSHPVTPSDEVDQAWHLHLVYTRSYWDELCGQVLGFPLHHGPTKGGPAEGHKFQDWYARTLQAYAAAFGTLPPADVWPPAAVRFGEAPYFRRVNLRRQWLLPRPRWPFRLGRREGLAVAAGLLLMGCTARTPLNPLNWYGTEFLWLFWGLCLTLLPLALWMRHRLRGPEADYLGEPPSTYELARLAHRGRRVAVGALAALVHTGKAALLPERRIESTGARPPDDPNNPYERTVWNLIAAEDTPSVAHIQSLAQQPSLERGVAVLDASLEAKGLLLPAAERQRLDLIPLLTAISLGLFGLTKVVVGLSRHRPVEYLVLSIVVMAVVALRLRWQYGAWATGRGTRLLRDFGLQVRHEQRAGSPTGKVVALSVALFGVSELYGLGMGELASSLVSPRQGSSDNGSNGGGDGGSGCGGCGGD